MKVDVKSEIVQWMLRMWLNRLIDRLLELILFSIHTATDKHLSGQRLDAYIKSLDLDTSTWVESWMESFSKKEMIVLTHEAADDTHLPFWIEIEATKDKWLKWLAALDLSDKKNGEILAMKCYFVGLHLTGLSMAEEMELQSLQNVESVCFELAVKSSMFVKAHTSVWLKTVSAKRSASYKTRQVDADRVTIKPIYEKYGQKNCMAFQAEAMLAIDKTARTVKNRLKELLEGQ